MLYFARDLKNRSLFPVLERYVKGKVLDVGGAAFFYTAQKKEFPFTTWTTIDPEPEGETIKDERYRYIQGDGCNMPFKDSSFDTVINMHVLEHVFEPNKMIAEIHRVLKMGGHAIFLIPCSANLHMAPFHYYNYTQFWIRRVMKDSNLQIVFFKPVGGLWTSTALRLSYLFLIAFRFSGMSTPYNKRNAFFYALFPFMAIALVVIIPACLLFSLGDLTENPNDHLVVVKK